MHSLCTMTFAIFLFHCLYRRLLLILKVPFPTESALCCRNAYRHGNNTFEEGKPRGHLTFKLQKALYKNSFCFPTWMHFDITWHCPGVYGVLHYLHCNRCYLVYYCLASLSIPLWQKAPFPAATLLFLFSSLSIFARRDLQLAKKDKSSNQRSSLKLQTWTEVHPPFNKPLSSDIIFGFWRARWTEAKKEEACCCILAAQAALAVA